MNYPPEDESIGFLLSMICKAHRTCVNDALIEIGLYAGQDNFLWQLRRHDGLTHSQMVERLCVQPPTVSKMLDRLERTGLVTRRPDSEDNRISRLYLTEQGRNSENAVCSAWHDLEQRMTENLTLEERILLRRLLLQVLENLARHP
jgi:DNA-binding MarR family transcriptional regulator